MADSYRAFRSTSSVSVDTRSNIAATTSSPQYLGQKVTGIDSLGFYGEWVWCLAGEALVAKRPLSPGMNSTAATVTTATQPYTVFKNFTYPDIPGRVPVVGLVEQNCDSGNYVWVRTKGFVASVLLWMLNPGPTVFNRGQHMYGSGNTSGGPNHWTFEIEIPDTGQVSPSAYLFTTTGAITAGANAVDAFISSSWL